MREIKFRGRCESSGEWVYGSLITEQIFTGKEWQLQYRIMSQGKREFYIWVVVNETIGQYTGLKDKNGKEIYEFDIVKSKLATHPEHLGFTCKFKDYRWKFINVVHPDDDFFGTVNYDYIRQQCEIIGNIHDNPELLKQNICDNQ